MPLPPQLARQLSSLPPSTAAQYREVLFGLVAPLERQAALHWEKAAAATDASAFWAARAHDRLTAATAPDC
jgi:hypothetical protein